MLCLLIYSLQPQMQKKQKVWTKAWWRAAVRPNLPQWSWLGLSHQTVWRITRARPTLSSLQHGSSGMDGQMRGECLPPLSAQFISHPSPSQNLLRWTWAHPASGWWQTAGRPMRTKRSLLNKWQTKSNRLPIRNSQPISNERDRCSSRGLFISMCLAVAPLANSPEGSRPHHSLPLQRFRAEGTSTNRNMCSCDMNTRVLPQNKKWSRHEPGDV